MRLLHQAEWSEAVKKMKTNKTNTNNKVVTVILVILLLLLLFAVIQAAGGVPGLGQTAVPAMVGGC